MEISLVFVNKEFGKIRVAEHNGAAWFVGSDVCDCLEIGNSRDAVASLQDDEKGVATTDTLSPQTRAFLYPENKKAHNLPL